MRKQYLALLLVLSLSSGVAFARTNPPGSIGMIKRVVGSDEDQDTKVFKLVRNGNQGANNTSFVSGDAVVYDTVSDDGITVARTTTSGDSAFAGILVTALLSSDGNSPTTSASDDKGRRNWGYMQVHGRALANVSAGGTNGNSAGDLFITSTDAGAITTFSGNANAAGMSAVKASGANGGFFYDAADGTSTSVEVQIENE